jgi:phage shock protein E
MYAVLIGRSFALAAILGTAAARPGVEFTKDSLEVVKKNVKANKAVLVDVRGPEEWNDGHIEGSIFVPVHSLRKHSLDPKKLGKTLPKKKILYTFCVVGMRAKTAAAILEKQGYAVRALKPGYEELIEAGFRKGKKTEAKEGEDEGARQRNAG